MVDQHHIERTCEEPLLLMRHKSHINAFLLSLLSIATQASLSGLFGLLLLQQLLALDLFLHLVDRLLLLARSRHGTVVKHQIRNQSRDFEAVFHFDHHHARVYDFRNLSSTNGAEEIHFISYLKVCHRFSD